MTPCLTPSHRILSRLKREMCKCKYIQCISNKYLQFMHAWDQQCLGTLIKLTQKKQTYRFHPRPMSSPLPGYKNARLVTLYAVLTWSRVFTTFIILSTTFATQLDEFRTASNMYALFRARDTSRTRALIIALTRGNNIIESKPSDCSVQIRVAPFCYPVGSLNKLVWLDRHFHARIEGQQGVQMNVKQAQWIHHGTQVATSYTVDRVCHLHIAHARVDKARSHIYIVLRYILSSHIRHKVQRGLYRSVNKFIVIDGDLITNLAPSHRILSRLNSCKQQFQISNGQSGKRTCNLHKPVEYINFRSVSPREDGPWKLSQAILTTMHCCRKSGSVSLGNSCR